jgi:hypothetical protein
MHCEISAGASTNPVLPLCVFSIGIERHNFAFLKTDFYIYVLHHSRLKNNLEENFV